MLMIAGAALLLTSGIANAAPSCTITSTTVSFGNYDPLNASDTTSTGTLTFRCSTGVRRRGITYQISLSMGSSTTYNPRTLKSGSNILNYNLYTDATFASIWGDGTAGTSTVSATITKAQAKAGVAVTVYGDIPAQQNVVVGSYTDSIIATVTF